MATPLCQYFNKCGGCTLQHIDYTLQLEQKRKKLAQFVGVDSEKVLVFSDKEYYYRNRIDFLFTRYGFGMRERGSSVKVLDIEKCVISDEKINEMLMELRLFFTNNDCFHLDTKKGTLKSAIVRSSEFGERAICFVLNEESSKLAEAMEKIREFAKKSSADHINVMTREIEDDDFKVEEDDEDSSIIKGAASMRERLCDKVFFYPVGGFFQNNSQVAEKMQQYVREILQQYETKEKMLLDLYGGVGTFGIINADLFQTVAVVESFPAGIQAAKQNIIENKVSNVLAYGLDAKQLRKVKVSGKLFVIADPPRSGMDVKVIQQLNELKPEVIVYVSCNPEQLGKDLVKFKEYTLKSVALFDMFPQTLHSEAVAELVRKN